MIAFEVGKAYYTTSACDHNCVFVVEIVKRTAKTVTFRRDGQERRTKIHTDRDVEYIVPERYSWPRVPASVNMWRRRRRAPPRIPRPPTFPSVPSPPHTPAWSWSASP